MRQNDYDGHCVAITDKSDESTPAFYGIQLRNRFMLGTARYPSLSILRAAFQASQACVATVSLRREGIGNDWQVDDAKQNSDKPNAHKQPFWQFIQSLDNVRILPNTAGCYSVKEAMLTAHMSRELFDTPWIKLEVIGNSDTLQPDVFALVEAAKLLTEEGFQVFPYTTSDLVVAEKLLSAGCEVLMPWGAPIGSGMGLNDPFALRSLRQYFPDTPLVIDAGLGLPSQAAQAMEMGYDAVLLNTAVARAGDPVRMAAAFAAAIQAGHEAALADPIEVSNMATPSTPLIGQAFLS